MQENGRRMQTPSSILKNNPVPVSLPDALRDFHKHLPLSGDPPNALLSLPAPLLGYLIAAIRNTPCPPPDLSPDEWHHFLALLHPHWILPLITFYVRTWPEECRPPREIMEHLDGILLHATARNLLAGRQIQAVTDALKLAGIPSILLKGHALARTVYPDPALRQSSDIDLLVQPHNIPGAETVLEKLGYTSPAKIFQIYMYADHHENFFPTGKGLRLQLHWATDDAYGLFPEGWTEGAFSRRITIQSGNLSCDTFSHADHFLYLVFHHAFQHRTIRLDYVNDISRIMSEFTTRDDWKVLSQQSVVHQIRISMELALTAASLWTGRELPDGVGDFSTWPAPSLRELRILKKSSSPALFLFLHMYLVLQGRPGIREKLRYGWYSVLPPTPLMHQYRQSPSAADIPLAHLRRWCRIVKYR